MVDGGKITLRFEVDAEQFKRILDEVNRKLEKTKEAVGGTSSATASLGDATEKTGKQTAAAAVQFQTMTQGAINLTTAFAQTYASISNIQRAHTSLAQSVVSLERAEDLLARKQFKKNQELAKAIPDMEKVRLLTNEIATAMDDYQVKVQKVKDQQDALNDITLLFGINLINVGFSAAQTAISMKNLAGEMKIATVASTIFNSSMGKIAIIATAVILAMEGITAVAKAMNVEWANQIPSLSNLGEAINKTFTSSDQILAKSKQNMKDYAEEWKSSTQVVRTETEAQTGLLRQWADAQKLQTIQMWREVGKQRQALQAGTGFFQSAPNTGAEVEIPFGLGAYGAVNKGYSSRDSKFIPTTTPEELRQLAYQMEMRHRIGPTVGAIQNMGTITDSALGIGSFYQGPFPQNQFGITTGSSGLTDDTVKILETTLQKAKNNLKNYQELLQNDPQTFNDFNFWNNMADTAEIIFNIEAKLEALGVKNKNTGPNLANLTSNTSFITTDKEMLDVSFASSLNHFKLSREYRRLASLTRDPSLKSKYLQLADKERAMGNADAQRTQIILAKETEDFKYGTNTGRGLYFRGFASGLSALGQQGIERGNPDVIRALSESNRRLTLGGQISLATSLFNQLGGLNITGLSARALGETLQMTLGGARNVLSRVRGGPLNVLGPSKFGPGTPSFPSGRSSSSASLIAGRFAGQGAARNRSGGHSANRRDRTSGKIASFFNMGINPMLLGVGLDGFSLGIPQWKEARARNSSQRFASDIRARALNDYISSVYSAALRAQELAGKYTSYAPSIFDTPLYDLDNFDVLQNALTSLSSWRNQVNNAIGLSFSNQASIENDLSRGRDELQDRVRFQERLASISTGVSSL